MNYQKIIVVSFFVWCVLLMRLNSQSILSVMSAAKAHASVASSNGLDAIFVNPAGIDNSFEQKKIEISVYNLGGKIGSTYLNSSDVKKVFGFGGSGSVERSQITPLLEDEKLFLNFGINLITLRYKFENAGSIGFNMSSRLYGSLKFDTNMLNIVQSGNIGNQDYLIINKGIGGAWVREIGVSYSKNIKLDDKYLINEIRIGVTPKLLMGITTLELDPNSYLAINQVNVRGAAGYRVRGGFIANSAHADNFNLAEEIASYTTNIFPTSAGSGFGINAGLQVVLLQNSKPESAVRLILGMAVQDIGSITWEQGFSRKLLMLDDTLTAGTISEQKFKEYAGVLYKGEKFTTKLPATLHTGLCGEVNLLNAALVNLDFEAEIPIEKIGGAYTNPRFALGADMSIAQRFSLGTGLTFGGVDNFALSLGFGLNITEGLKINLATGALNKFFSGKQYDFAARISYAL